MNIEKALHKASKKIGKKDGIQKGWWVTEHDGVELWHFKRSPRSMTKLYRSLGEMVADNDKWDFYWNCPKIGG